MQEIGNRKLAKAINGCRLKKWIFQFIILCAMILLVDHYIRLGLDVVENHIPNMIYNTFEGFFDNIKMGIHLIREDFKGRQYLFHILSMIGIITLRIYVIQVSMMVSVTVYGY